MQKNAAHRRKRGFTLQEMLLVILLFAILAGLAIPGVISLQRSLHMKKLDEYARQIYIAAQNELTEMKASGRLELFAKELEQQGDRLTSEPSDYPEGEEDSWKDLFHVSSDSTEGQNYLLRANDSLRQATEQGGSFILELNPISGDVYSAFYAEESFTYDQVCSITQENRDKSTRQKATPQLGYYSSSTDEYGTVGMPSKFEPKIEVVNGEELALNVSCGNLMALRRTQSYLALTLTISDEHDHQVELPAYRGGTDFFVVNDSVTVTKILDSLDEQNRFAAVLPTLTAGDNLTITAKMTYEDKNNNIFIMGETTVDNVNSLFAAKNTEDSVTTIQVDHVRHLNNLRSDIYAADTSAQIVQTGDISFLFSDWTAGTDYVSAWTASPMSKFPAIDNAALLNGGSFDGGLNILSNFDFTVSGMDRYAALFGALDHTALNGVRLVDCAADGDAAATLAGRTADCTVTDCGAYLTTRDDMGAAYDMTARRGQYRVNGVNAAGGLIAIAENTDITASFGAVDVNGGANNGGLVGQLTGGSVKQSYGSGNITATGANNGGLAGQAANAALSDCYATSKVQAASYSGGLVGRASGGSATNCTSYGRVTTDGEQENGANCGGLVGSSTGTGFSGCAFLQQASYNSNYRGAAGINASAYTVLRKNVSETEQIGLTTPYLAGLQGHGFPFPLCKNGESQMMHYGDWPEAYQLQTSLVYYERYADGNYGYYARTSLTSGGESAGDNWVVDTLRDEYCVEDGYALMTAYVLESFDYTLDRKQLSNNQLLTGSVTITTDENDSKNALLLLSDAELKFENMDNASGQETTISHAKVYRLPFALQITDRITASSFWETLKITGISSITHQAVFEDQTFYYCPDFAKNAVNPADGEPATPDEPGGDNGTPVYIRSPRQLNGLSRSTYYWNTKNGGPERVQFIQETDLEYSKYTKKYCGVTYDLMDTSSSNPYRNKPIGFPNGTASGNIIVNNFRNSYDGQGHKIVDYCALNTEYRFAGLFGEVEKCVIKNVVMEASEPYKSAYVRSSAPSVWNEPPGVGALVGLAYMPRSADCVGEPASVIENCSVSGYIVEYCGNTSNTNTYTVGGLIGFNFGEVRNCSAVCDVRMNDTKQKEGFAGGLVGSLNGKGTIDNSYAGGKFYVNKYAKVGGLCGGYVDTYGYGMQDYNRTNKNPDAAGTLKMRISNCYSYSTIRHGTDAIAQGTGRLFGVCVPVLDNNDKSNQISIDNCYYLTDTIEENALYTKVTDGSQPVSYSALTKLSLPAANGATASGAADAANSHPFSTSTDLAGKAYPFPALVRTADGSAYVHYGDWPVSTTVQLGDLELTQTAYLVYYEQYADDSIGVYTVDGSGAVGTTIRNDLDIKSAGYAYLTSTKNLQVSVQWQPFNAGSAFGETIVASYVPGYDLIALGQGVQQKLNEAGHYVKKYINLMEQNWSNIQVLYLNDDFAFGIYTNQANESTYKLRTAQQLQNTSGLSYKFVLDHDIVIPADMEFASLNTAGSSYDGNGYVIRGLSVPLFQNVNGTAIQGIVLKDVNIVSSSDVAALVNGDCNGTIQNCAVIGSVKSTGGSAAGMIRSVSGGTVTNCYFTGTVSAVGRASGFCLSGYGTVARCYVNAQFERQGTSTTCYGFAPTDNTGAPTDSYYLAVAGLSDGVGIPCTTLDWSAAIDANGAPGANWPTGIQAEPVNTAAADTVDAAAAPAADEQSADDPTVSTDDAA